MNHQIQESHPKLNTTATPYQAQRGNYKKKSCDLLRKPSLFFSMNAKFIFQIGNRYTELIYDQKMFYNYILKCTFVYK